MKESVMRSFLLTLGTFLMLAATSAWAGRPVTDDEGAKLLQSVAAAGCSGGKLEFDDGKFEVEDAECSDGQTYELKFDEGFQLIKKELED
jgi:Peptidase propeptide and YPEB domain